MAGTHSGTQETFPKSAWMEQEGNIPASQSCFLIPELPSPFPQHPSDLALLCLRPLGTLGDPWGPLPWSVRPCPLSRLLMAVESPGWYLPFCPDMSTIACPLIPPSSCLPRLVQAHVHCLGHSDCQLRSKQQKVVPAALARKKVVSWTPRAAG